MPATVLLLEAREDFRTIHAQALRHAGLDVMDVGGSRAARDAARTLVPRVIVATFDSRTRDEILTFCRDIKADSLTKGIPIVLMSADVTDGDVELATDLGVLVLTVTEPDGGKAGRRC